MKKVFSLLKRLNVRLLTWQRKHPILDAYIGSIFLSMIVIGFVLVVCSQDPDLLSCSCDGFCAHQAFGSLGVMLGFTVSWIGDIWANCFHILRSRKEAAE